MSLQEPWLRGTVTGLDPLRAQVLFSFEQALEDAERFTNGCSDAEIWIRPYGLGSIGFHLAHITGSVDRLLTYALGQGLSEVQFTALQREKEQTSGREEALRRFREALTRAGETVRKIAPGQYGEPRTVGRQKLPTTVGNLLVHISEHTQRHVGQIITTAAVVKGMAAN